VGQPWRRRTNYQLARKCQVPRARWKDGRRTREIPSNLTQAFPTGILICLHGAVGSWENYGANLLVLLIYYFFTKPRIKMHRWDKTAASNDASPVPCWRASPRPASRATARRGTAEPFTLGRHRQAPLFTASQSGRGRKGPLWVTQPNPLPKQGHPGQAAQDLSASSELPRCGTSRDRAGHLRS